MLYLIETERLSLRELTPADAEWFYELNTDPEVIRYTGDVAFESVAASREFLVNYQQYKKYGYGRWAVILKSTGEPLGWCGLKYLEEEQITDLGYRFFRKHWGKGYATESARACMEYGLRELKLPLIIGQVMSPNVASANVLKKLGMEFYKSERCDGQDAEWYKVSLESRA